MTAGGAVRQEDREERKMKQQLSVISQGDAKPEDYVESLADFPLSRSVPLSLSVHLFLTLPCGQLPLQFQFWTHCSETRLSLGATPVAVCLVFTSPSLSLSLSHSLSLSLCLHCILAALTFSPLALISQVRTSVLVIVAFVNDSIAICC